MMGNKYNKNIFKILAFSLGFFVSTNAMANVTFSCASDYYSYCSDYSLGSNELKQCMRRNGNKLSRGCIQALVDAGEVTKDEVYNRARKAGKLIVLDGDTAESVKKKMADLERKENQKKKSVAKKQEKKTLQDKNNKTKSMPKPIEMVNPKLPPEKPIAEKPKTQEEILKEQINKTPVEKVKEVTPIETVKANEVKIPTPVKRETVQEIRARHQQIINDLQEKINQRKINNQEKVDAIRKSIEERRLKIEQRRQEVDPYITPME